MYMNTYSNIYIYMYNIMHTNVYIYILSIITLYTDSISIYITYMYQYVPHKAVAEVSKIGNL